jgi:DNA-binding GntR family transcriptional regulator
MSAPTGTAADGLPLYEVIYRVLRQHIADEALPLGLVIGEAAVARAFQSSRAPAGAALRRLRDEGWLSSFDGRGLLVGVLPGGEPIRLDLIKAGLTVPGRDDSQPKARNRRLRIYPEVEHVVACCLPYGRFHLNESLLADYYGVSRTVAHEVLTQLDRVGLVTQDRNRRWYAGPMSAERMREHFELRWLLEPVALDQAFRHLDRDALLANKQRIRAVQAGKRTPAKLEGLERDLHIDTVLKCSNSRLADAIRRSQLPLIATHDTFQRHLDTDEVETMLAEHLSIFERLLAEEPDKARNALEEHLRRSAEPNVRRLGSLGVLPASRRVPFLVETD